MQLNSGLKIRGQGTNDLYNDNKDFQLQNSSKFLDNNKTNTPNIKSKPFESNKNSMDDEKDFAFKEILKEMGLPLEYPDYSSIDYWNHRYSNQRNESFEW